MYYMPKWNQALLFVDSSLQYFPAHCTEQSRNLGAARIRFLSSLFTKWKKLRNPTESCRCYENCFKRHVIKGILHSVAVRRFLLHLACQTMWTLPFGSFTRFGFTQQYLHTAPPSCSFPIVWSWKRFIHFLNYSSPGLTHTRTCNL